MHNTHWCERTFPFKTAYVARLVIRLNVFIVPPSQRVQQRDEAPEISSSDDNNNNNKKELIQDDEFNVNKEDEDEDITQSDAHE